jgi:chromosomal replication initiation ATPase DnaA
MKSKLATPYGKRRLKEGLSVVTRYWGVTSEDVLGRSRLRHITNARHSLRYYLCMSEDLTLSEIGLLTNGDHSSVIHSKKTFDILEEYDKDYKVMNMMFKGEIQHTFNISRKTRISEILVSGLTVQDKTEQIMELYENR